MGVYEPLIPDVVASKTQLQLCEFSGPTFRFITQEFSMVGGYTQNLKKPENYQNWRVGACSGVGAFSGQYGKIKIPDMAQTCCSIICCDVPTHVKCHI